MTKTCRNATLITIAGKINGAVAIWGIVFACTRYVSVASIAAAVVLPVAVWCFEYGAKMTLVMTAMAVLAIYKHKANIRRLLDGTENRAGAKKHQAPP